MAKKKEEQKEEKETKPTQKEIIVSLNLKRISPQIYETKKEGVKEILTVTLENKNEGVTVTIKGNKASHPLRKWDKRIFEEEEEIVMTLSVPNMNQKKITDFKE